MKREVSIKAGGSGNQYGGVGRDDFQPEEEFFRLMKSLSLIPVLLVGFLLVFAAQDFPEWGNPQSPASKSPVSSHFIAETGVDTEVPNMVTAVLADYRPPLELS